MGDRGNIKVGKVYLYTHWGGYRIKQILQTALKKKLRWDDEPYLTRIIFCEMIKGDTEGETGYGISTYECDNERPILEVDVEKQRVNQLDYAIGEEWEKKGKSWTFEEFINLELKDEN